MVRCLDHPLHTWAGPAETGATARHLWAWPRRRHRGLRGGTIAARQFLKNRNFSEVEIFLHPDFLPHPDLLPECLFRERKKRGHNGHRRGPFVAGGGSEKMLISYNPAYSTSFQPWSPTSRNSAPPVGTSAM